MEISRLCSRIVYVGSAKGSLVTTLSPNLTAPQGTLQHVSGAQIAETEPESTSQHLQRTSGVRFLILVPGVFESTPGALGFQ